MGSNSLRHTLHTTSTLHQISHHTMVAEAGGTGNPIPAKDRPCKASRRTNRLMHRISHLGITKIPHILNPASRTAHIEEVIAAFVVPTTMVRIDACQGLAPVLPSRMEAEAVELLLPNFRTFPGPQHLVHEAVARPLKHHVHNQQPHLNPRLILHPSMLMTIHFGPRKICVSRMKVQRKRRKRQMHQNRQYRQHRNQVLASH